VLAHRLLFVVLVAVASRRWAIEEAFGTAKSELGLDHNQICSRHGWHRHVLLVMPAFAMIAALRCRAHALAPQKGTGARAAAL
jgi:SRSO17 transposase